MELAKIFEHASARVAKKESPKPPPSSHLRQDEIPKRACQGPLKRTTPPSIVEPLPSKKRMTCDPLTTIRENINALKQGSRAGLDVSVSSAPSELSEAVDCLEGARGNLLPALHLSSEPSDRTVIEISDDDSVTEAESGRASLLPQSNAPAPEPVTAASLEEWKVYSTMNLQSFRKTDLPPLEYLPEQQRYKPSKEMRKLKKNHEITSKQKPLIKRSTKK